MEVLLKTQGKENRHLLGVLAKVRSDSGDPARAAEAWRERRELHPGDLFARKMEAYALRKAGQLDRAAGLFRACVMDDPDDLVLFRTYIHLQYQRGALAELRESLEPLLPVAGSRRGAVYGELRKPSSPRSRRASKRWPTSASGNWPASGTGTAR
jgi:predicted Zn-dependent protease